MKTYEKYLYNQHLRISRSIKNKPFKLRKTFDNVKDEDIIAIKRILTFLNKFPQIDSDIYFKAPYEIYPDTEYFNLAFYATPKAIKAFTTYQKQLIEQSPDMQLDTIKKSFTFIVRFCLKNNIKLENYITHKTGITYSWMQHLKNYDISIYPLLGFEKFTEVVESTPKDELDLFFGDIYKNIHVYKTRYFNSKEAKKYIENAIFKLKNFVEKNINHDNINISK